MTKQGTRSIRVVAMTTGETRAALERMAMSEHRSLSDLVRLILEREVEKWVKGGEK